MSDRLLARRTAAWMVASLCLATFLALGPASGIALAWQDAPKTDPSAAAGGSAPAPGGGGDAVEVVKPDPGFVHGAADQAVQVADMGPGGNLRHDAAIDPVVIILGAHHVRQHRAVIPDHRGGGFITAGFNTENTHGAWMPGSICPIQANRIMRLAI